MKRSIPFWLVLSIISIVCLIYGSWYIYQQRNDVDIIEMTYAGDIKNCGDVQFLFRSEDTFFIQNTIVSLKDGLQKNTNFEPMARGKEYTQKDRFDIEVGNSIDIWDRIDNKTSGTYCFYLKDICDYLPMELSVRNEDGFFTTACEENELLKVEMKEDAMLIVEVEVSSSVTSTSILQQNFNGYRLDLPHIKTKDGYYFTINNQELERDYMEMEGSIADYSGTSGVLYIDCSNLSKSNSLYENIDRIVQICAPIEISAQNHVVVLDIKQVPDSENMILAVMENQELYIYYYDINKEDFISKSKILTIPDNTMLNKINFVLRDKKLLVFYTYQDMEEKLIYSGIVCELTKQQTYQTILAHEFVDTDLPDMFTRLIAEVADLYYSNNVLYILFHNFGDTNRLGLLACNQEQTIYAGILEPSIYEDNHKGEADYESNRLTDYFSRRIEKVYFLP